MVGLGPLQIWFVKQCKICREELPEERFFIRLKRPNGRTGYSHQLCKKCRFTENRQWRERTGRFKNRSKLAQPYTDNLGVLVKRCSKCKTPKPVDQFHKAKQQKFGLHSRCKACISEAQKSSRTENPIRFQHYFKRWYDENDFTPEQKNQRQLNVTACEHRRRAQRLAAPHEIVRVETIIERDGLRCYLCGKQLDPTKRRSVTLDHVIPLARGGSHTAANIRIACGKCNSKKGKKTLEEYLASKTVN